MNYKVAQFIFFPLFFCSGSMFSMKNDVLKRISLDIERWDDEYQKNCLELKKEKEQFDLMRHMYRDGFRLALIEDFKFKRCKFKLDSDLSEQKKRKSRSELLISVFLLLQVKKNYTDKRQEHIKRKAELEWYVENASKMRDISKKLYIRNVEKLKNKPKPIYSKREKIVRFIRSQKNKS